MTSTKFKPGMIFLILSAEELNFTPEEKLSQGKTLQYYYFL